MLRKWLAVGDNQLLIYSDDYLMFQVLGSKSEYHFVNHAVPHARTKRSLIHMRQLKKDPLVSICSSCICLFIV